MALLLGVNTALSTISTIGNALGLGHPKDGERRQKADALYQRALNGDTEAEHQLDCLSGSQTYAAEFNALAPPGCGFATQSTRDYAKDLLAKLHTNRTVAAVAGDVASGAARVGLATGPDTFLSTVATNTAGAVGLSSIPGWAWIAGAGVLAFVLFKGIK